jgi:peptide/nickel transport system substrate-binding protein
VSRRGLQLVVTVCLVSGGLLAIFVQPAARGSTSRARAGGVFRISLPGLDYIDPALSYTVQGWTLIDTTCARLMTHPDKAPPEGYRLVPEVATGYPSVSHDGKTWTFNLRSGFRFSDGTPVRASAFARAINRTLAPGVVSAGAQYTQDIVGADDVQAGKAASAVGVVARGSRLVVRFTRPIPDFPARTAMPFFCAVPPTLPADPEGVGAFPGAGPYYVAEYRTGQKLVIKRNRFYSGKRPHHVDAFVADLGAGSPSEVLDRIEGGEADWGDPGVPATYFEPGRRLVAKYGVNRSQFFVKPGLSSLSYALNTSRPLFRNNVRLRRAVNFAIDRRALVLAAGTPRFASATDQLLPPGLPGFKDARIYPLVRPELAKARALASGHTRGGKLVLYTINFPQLLARAQIVSRDLAKIGLEVEVKGFPELAYDGRVNRPEEPYDIAFLGWFPDYLDPFADINLLLDGRFIGTSNLARFNSVKYNALMRRAARLRGDARYRAYGRLDVQISRDAAPLIPILRPNAATLVSKRVGCVVLRPTLDLTTVCLKQ